jgi:hypothetical protein
MNRIQFVTPSAVIGVMTHEHYIPIESNVVGAGSVAPQGTSSPGATKTVPAA